MMEILPRHLVNIIVLHECRHSLVILFVQRIP